MSSTSLHSPLCHSPDLDPSPYPLTNGGLTVHQIFIIISAVSVCFAWSCGISQSIYHFIHTTKRHEQRYLVRIINLPLVFGLFFLFSTVWYSSSQYLGQIPFMYEAICVCGLFEVFCMTVAGPDRREQEIFFQSLERQNWRLKRHHDRGSLRWFKTIHLIIYSFPLVVTLDCLIEIIAAATICPSSKVSTVIKSCFQAVTIISTNLTSKC